jgi:Immunity protein 53
MSPLRALEVWYARSCDGDWEHSFGVTIETLDNPGWAVRIDLAETALAGRSFEAVRIDRAPDDWLHCAVEADVFKGYGGPGNLHEILDAFARWAQVEPRRGQAPAAKAPAAG